MALTTKRREGDSVTPEQVAYWVQQLGWNPDEVVEYRDYFATGHPG